MSMYKENSCLWLDIPHRLHYPESTNEHERGVFDMRSSVSLFSSFVLPGDGGLWGKGRHSDRLFHNGPHWERERESKDVDLADNGEAIVTRPLLGFPFLWDHSCGPDAKCWWPGMAQNCLAGSEEGPPVPGSHYSPPSFLLHKETGSH